LGTILAEWRMDKWPLEIAGGTEVAGGVLGLDGMVMALGAKGRENEIEKGTDNLTGSDRVGWMKHI
jgi:hypothetical protein